MCPLVGVSFLIDVFFGILSRIKVPYSLADRLDIDFCLDSLNQFVTKLVETNDILVGDWSAPFI